MLEKKLEYLKQLRSYLDAPLNNNAVVDFYGRVLKVCTSIEKDLEIE